MAIEHPASGHYRNGDLQAVVKLRGEPKACRRITLALPMASLREETAATMRRHQGLTHLLSWSYLARTAACPNQESNFKRSMVSAAMLPESTACRFS